MFTLATIATTLSVAAVIGWAFMIARRWMYKATKRELYRQRRIARAQRLAMAGKRRARVIRSESAANSAMAKEASDNG